jgi:hypothetical protein
MPYIQENLRPQYRNILEQLPNIPNKGELEYCIFYIMKKYMKDKSFKYSNLHDTVYASQHCSDEFRRRYLDPREDKALGENGDV